MSDHNRRNQRLLNVAVILAFLFCAALPLVERLWEEGSGKWLYGILLAAAFLFSVALWWTSD